MVKGRVLDLFFSNSSCDVYRYYDHVLPEDEYKPSLILEFSFRYQKYVSILESITLKIARSRRKNPNLIAYLSCRIMAMTPTSPFLFQQHT